MHRWALYSSIGIENYVRSHPITTSQLPLQHDVKARGSRRRQYRYCPPKTVVSGHRASRTELDRIGVHREADIATQHQRAIFSDELTHNPIGGSCVTCNINTIITQGNIAAVRRPDGILKIYGALRLSQARAEAVVRALIGAGVDPSRLDAAGFGEMRPVSTNDTEEGRQENRRVEFIIVERE